MLVLAVQNSRISHKIKKMIKLSIEFRNSEAHCFFGHPQAARINRRLRCNSNLTFAHVPSIIQLKLLLCLYWCENRYCSQPLKSSDESACYQDIQQNGCGGVRRFEMCKYGGFKKAGVNNARLNFQNFQKF